MKLDYFLYMAEAEGHDELVDTRLAKLNAIGKDLKNMGYAGETVPAAVFMAICKSRGFALEDITPDDIEYIEENWL